MIVFHRVDSLLLILLNYLSYFRQLLRTDGGNPADPVQLMVHVPGFDKILLCDGESLTLEVIWITRYGRIFPF